MQKKNYKLLYIKFTSPLTHIIHGERSMYTALLILPACTVKVLSILVFSFITLYLVTLRKSLLQNSNLSFKLFCIKIIFIVLTNL